MKSLNGNMGRLAGNLVALSALAVLISCGSKSGGDGQPTSTAVTVGLSPSSITGPGNVTGTVTISPAAPAGGATVSLQITAGSGTLSASQVAIAQGATQAGFTLTVNAVASATNVEVTATYGSTTGRGSVSVSPSANTSGLTDLQLNPQTGAGDGTVVGTVVLGSGAPAGGSAVSLASSSSAAASVPPTVTVPQGATSANFNIAIKAVGGGQNITITATLGAVSIPKTLRLEPITANFSVVPDAGTGANPPLQCAVTNSGDAASPNLLQCTFDASSSLPTTGITNYRWTLPGLANPINQNSSQLIRPKVGCGAGLNTVNVQLAVTLVVTAPGGTSSPKTQMVLFTKAGPC